MFNSQQGPKNIDIIDCRTVRTLPGLFWERVARTPDASAYREFDTNAGCWRDYSWSDTADMVGQYQARFDAENLDEGDRVGILIPNGVNWVAFDVAAMGCGFVTVPLYTHDSPANLVRILKDSGVRLLLLDRLDQWRDLENYSSELPALKRVWIRQLVEGDIATSESGPQVSSLQKVLPGSHQPVPGASNPNALATLIYTSGTTGHPKGVMLSHAAILWNAEAITKFIPPLRTDVFLSILPLAHAFERTMGHYLPMMAGSTVAYVRSIDTLREDLTVVRPTILLAVPRLYERIHAAILAKAEKNWLTRKLADLTAKIGWRTFGAQRNLAARPGFLSRLAWPLLEYFVARRAMAAFGGRLRVAVSGGAALPTDVAQFLIGMGLPLVEGYGLTETAPVVTATTLADSLPGSVGRPLHGLEVRLGKDDELLVRSPAMMMGYWRDGAATAKVLNDESWLKTGDIARLDDGRVYIEGRLTDTIILSTGKKVSSTIIEECIQSNPLFDQVCIVGSGRPCLCALIVLNRDRWDEQAAAWGVNSRLPNSSDAVKAVLKRVRTLTADMPKHAVVRIVHLILESWTVESGLVTPTLKVKRQAVEQRYIDEISALYKQLVGGSR